MGGLNLYKEFAGVIKSYNADKGYGFVDNAEIKTAFGRDVFLSRAEVEKHDLQVGSGICSCVGWWA